MGRIKSTSIKSLGDEILAEHADLFTDDFGKNKETLGKIKEIESKKIRNVLAGYITKEIRRIKKSGL